MFHEEGSYYKQKCHKESKKKNLCGIPRKIN